MILAFNNEFNPIFVRLNDNLNENKNNEKLKEPDPEFKKQWLKYREYQYYQEHKLSVDQYSIPTPNMLISLDEAKELKSYLQQKELERHQEIEEHKKRKYQSFELKQIRQENYDSSNDKDSIPNKSKIKTLIRKLIK